MQVTQGFQDHSETSCLRHPLELSLYFHLNSDIWFTLASSNFLALRSSPFHPAGCPLWTDQLIPSGGSGESILRETGDAWQAWGQRGQEKCSEGWGHQTMPCSRASPRRKRLRRHQENEKKQHVQQDIGAYIGLNVGWVLLKDLRRTKPDVCSVSLQCQKHSKDLASHLHHDPEVPNVSKKKLRHRKATCWNIRVRKWSVQD